MNVTAIRGFNDILPDPARLYRELEQSAFALFSTYGYSEIRLPVVEKTELFKRGIGETTDIVEKEMYTFADRRGESLTLRPEGTAPAVRAYIEHKMYTAPVTRLYYTGPMFRYERPQKGRYRQFYQIGAEVLGDASPDADAELIEMLMRYFASLGLDEITLGINSLGCEACRPGYRQALHAFLVGVREELCENCKRRIDANPLRALDCKSAGCMEATEDAPRITETLCADCSGHFAGVQGRLLDFGVSAALNPRMVRGLDYYTRTTFEITSTGLGAQSAVAAGGRYDRLVEELGGPATPCIGFAVGMERLSLLVKEARKGRDERTRGLSVLMAMGEQESRKAIELARELRDAGCIVVNDLSGGALKRRMKRADRLGARFVIIIGSDELAEGAATVKDMPGATQSRVAFEGLCEFISRQAGGEQWRP